MTTVIHWFRQDLRLTDNPALTAAAKAGQVLPIYVLDDVNAEEHAMGGASRLWLHHSLHALNKSLKGKLAVYSGDASKILLQLVEQHNVQQVYWNRCYEPWRMQRDARIKTALQEQSIEVFSHNGSLLWEPWQVLKADSTPYKVFTPFYRRGCLNAVAPREPLPKPARLRLQDDPQSLAIEALDLVPDLPWAQEVIAHWQVGEKAALKRLEHFLSEGLCDYRKGRDFPGIQHVSRLSPYLHFGEISPNQVWYQASIEKLDNNLEHFKSELGWREFSYSLLYHFNELPWKNLQEKFDKFPWRSDEKKLRRWQQGQTGFPFIDAGMRELWQTGYMHNRVRMVVASFLVKNLLLHWHHGEQWFWDCLFDADLASNSASWQWVAGCGADAAPYFRIFNPVTQGEKFDPAGEYTRRFVPELAKLPEKFLHKPWEAPQDVLKQAGVELGKTYPEPMVDLKLSRAQALEALEVTKS